MRFSENPDVVVAEAIRWRQHLHQNPELGYDVHATAEFIRARLEDFGCDEVSTGLGRTGVVGVIRSQRPGKVLGLRADMDALPIVEKTGKDYASAIAGRMHACGHDGHCAMLLATARVLAAERDFDGTAVVIFQPAEERGCGGRAMVEDGLMDRFAIDEVYGMHNLPQLPVGHFSIRSGPIMAATGIFDITVQGVSSHAALPHLGRDPVATAAELVSGLQKIVSRRIDAREPAVLSVTKIAGGDSYNIIPETVSLAGTVRTLSDKTMADIEALMRGVCMSLAQREEVAIDLEFTVTCPATVNHERETGIAYRAAVEVANETAVDGRMQAMMIGEDFCFMLQARPGAFIFIGNGSSEDLHHPAYDFDDNAIVHGVRYWLNLVGYGGAPAEG